MIDCCRFVSRQVILDHICEIATRNESTLRPLTMLQIYVVEAPLRQILNASAPPAGSSERVFCIAGHTRRFSERAFVVPRDLSLTVLQRAMSPQ